jgi:Spy/CpxP family protein refolding chaperone
MNRIAKQLAIATGFLLLGTTPMLTKAQDNAPAPAQGQAQAMPQHDEKGGMLAGLNLTDDQKAQVKQIHEGAKAKADAVKADPSLSADQKEAKIREIHRDTHEQVMKNVLTPEQRKQVRENMHERKESKQQAPPASN